MVDGKDIDMKVEGKIDKGSKVAFFVTKTKTTVGGRSVRWGGNPSRGRYPPHLGGDIRPPYVG